MSRKKRKRPLVVIATSLDRDRALAGIGIVALAAPSGDRPGGPVLEVSQRVATRSPLELENRAVLTALELAVSAGWRSVDLTTCAHGGTLKGARRSGRRLGRATIDRALAEGLDSVRFRKVRRRRRSRARQLARRASGVAARRQERRAEEAEPMSFAELGMLWELDAHERAAAEETPSELDDPWEIPF